MRAKPNAPYPDLMRLKLACVRAAQEVLPHGAAAADVMRLGREFYRWIGDDRPRPRRKLQRRLIKEAIGKFANPVHGTPYRTYALARVLIKEGAARAEQRREKSRQRARRPTGKLRAPVTSPEPSARLGGRR